MNNASRLFGIKTNATWFQCEQIILDLCFLFFCESFFLELVKREEHMQALKLNCKGGCKIYISHNSELGKVNIFLFKSKFVLFFVYLYVKWTRRSRENLQAFV